jgi:hypothetical protein
MDSSSGPEISEVMTKENSSENVTLKAAAGSSPAVSNELLNVELSWAWEPMHSSRAISPGAGKRSLSPVCGRDRSGRS